MNEKKQILGMLREEFDRWEELLASLSEEQITARHLPANLSIKDVIAHLRAWQQVSIARLEAAHLNKEPVFPDWLAGSDPESEGALDQFNARIHETYREAPWPRVHQLWRDGFLRFLELGEAIPEDELMDTEKYAWLKGYNLYAVLEGSYEHHHIDHLEPMLADPGQHGYKKTSRTVQVTLDRLAALVGEWTGRGRGGFPTLEGFDYSETLRVHRDQDATYLTYEQNTELIDADGRSMRKSHWEAGVIRPLEDGSIELACVHGSGRVEVLRGKFLAQESQPSKFSLYFESTLIGNDERVRSSSREWNRSGNHFKYVMKMATTNVGALTNHLEATLIKK